MKTNELKTRTRTKGLVCAFLAVSAWAMTSSLALAQSSTDMWTALAKNTGAFDPHPNFSSAPARCGSDCRQLEFIATALPAAMCRWRSVRVADRRKSGAETMRAAPRTLHQERRG